MRQILSIAHYEIVHISKERIIALMVFIVPLFYAVLLGAVYISGTLQQVPLGIVDLNQSVKSREIMDAFENAPNFKVIPQIQTYAELENGMKNGTIRAGVVIPEDYDQKLSQHQLTPIQTVYDGSNLIYGFNTRKFFQQVLGTFSARQTASYLAGLGFTKQEVTNTMEAVSYNLEVWYNANLSYGTFIFSGLVMMILHQVGLLAAALTVIREKESHTWIQFLVSPVPSWKIYLGKVLPYFTANIFNYGLLLWFSAHIINVKIEGSVSLMLLLGLLFQLVIVSLGFLISLYAPSSLILTRFLMLMSVPIFAISGYSWPSSDMPQALNALARLLPYTWMAEAFRLVSVKNAGWDQVSIQLIVLASMAALTCFLAMTFSKRRRAS